MPETINELTLASDFEPATRAAWEALVAKVLKGGDFRKRLVSRTADGIEIEPLYTRDMAPAAAADGRPGAAPFTRGTTARRTGPVLRLLCALTDPAAANAAILEELEGGASSITLAIAAPGQAGLAPTPDAIGAALAGVELGAITVSFAPGAQFEATAAAAAAVWAARDIAPDAIAIALGADPIGDIALTGHTAGTTEDRIAAAVGLATDGPLARATGTVLRASGLPVHEALGSEAQEIAFAATSLIAYLRAARTAGIAPAALLPRVEILLAADADLFATIAKIRAARRVVWRIADTCGAGDAAARCVFAARTSARMMSRRDPWVNMLRTTAAATGAMLAGVDVLTVLPFTAALGQPDAFARRMARNTGIILDEESGLARVADPAGGTWYVEQLTDQLAAKAWSILQEIEAEGGMPAALTSGLLQDQVAAVAAERLQQIATGRQQLTGTSTFPKLGPDGVTVTPAPDAPPVTGNRICEPLRPRRLGEAFESLRDRADAARAAGRNPTVFLACLGTRAEHGTRTTWIENYLASAGIAAQPSTDLTQSQDAGAQFADSGCKVACICGTDAGYAELAEATAMALKGAGASHVYLAGRPGDLAAALQAAGVDDFLFAGQDAPAALGNLLENL